MQPYCASYLAAICLGPSGGSQYLLPNAPPVIPMTPRVPLLHSVDLHAHAASLSVVFGSYMPGAVWGIAVSDTQRPSCHSYDTQSASIALCGPLRTCSLFHMLCSPALRLRGYLG
jgi:hypothetical protein